MKKCSNVSEYELNVMSQHLFHSTAMRAGDLKLKTQNGSQQYLQNEITSDS